MSAHKFANRPRVTLLKHSCAWRRFSLADAGATATDGKRTKRKKKAGRFPRAGIAASSEPACAFWRIRTCPGGYLPPDAEVLSYDGFMSWSSKLAKPYRIEDGRKFRL